MKHSHTAVPTQVLQLPFEHGAQVVGFRIIAKSCLVQLSDLKFVRHRTVRWKEDIPKSHMLNY